MKYFIIAGEASGDLHGANLMKAIVARDSKAEFAFWGGDLMQNVAQQSPLKHIQDLAFMGFTEVLLNLRTILNNIKLCKKQIADFKPDAVVFIDYPGFNLRMAEYSKSEGYKTIYYISPQVWAWKANRVKKIKAFVDIMLCILPFEQEFYRARGVQVEYVGHPLLDVVYEMRKKIDIDKKRASIALIPGSRKQEISRMLPVMLKVAMKFPLEQFVVTAAPAINEAFYQSFALPKNVELKFGKTHEVMLLSKAALVTSGTATLETALFNTPEVVCYKGGYISYLIARQLIKVKYISLVNLIMDAPIVKELIQSDFNDKQAAKELQFILEKQNREAMLKDYSALRKKLGGHGASERASEKIVEALS